MYIIAMYDISTTTKAGQRRLNKILKLFRRYLHHAQKSVFEGELSQAKYIEIKTATNNLISPTEDYVLFFTVANKKNVNKDILGIDFDATANILD